MGRYLELLNSSVKHLSHAYNSYQNEILVAVGVLFLAYFIGALIRKARSNFPPGPIGLPIVGYLPFLSENVHLDFMKLGRKYGDVFSVRLGAMHVVVLNGIEAIKEANSKPEFLGRASHTDVDAILPNSPFFSDNLRSWHEQRRFVVASMKDLGLGKSKIEDSVQDEISHFLDVLKSHKGQPMDLKDPLSPSMSNNIGALVFGKRLDYDDPDRKFLDKNLDVAEDAIGNTSTYTYFPWMRFIPFSIKFMEVRKALSAFDNINKYFSQEIEKHKKTFDPRNIRDFIDSYLLEMQNRKQKDPTTTFSDETLIANVMDLFAAGSETVRSTILWCIYVIAAHPEVQKKVQQEILDVIGSERRPNFSDQREMPYTQSVILEIMRWKTLVPLNLIRTPTADIKVGGYDIPKDTYVLVNIWNAHHDPRYWNEPDTFKPDRFLNADGTAVVKSSNFIAFSLGKRLCPGETMAHMEVFLYFTSILQKFDVVFPEGVKPDYSAKSAVVYRKEPYDVRFIPK